MELKPRYTLGKTERLKSRKLIEQLFREGSSFSNFPFRVIWMLNEGQAGILQVGMSASTKNFKRSVDRNRIKRLMRESWRLQKNHLQEVLAKKENSGSRQLSVFLIYVGNELPEYKMVYDKIGNIIKRLLKMLDEKVIADT